MKRKALLTIGLALLAGTGLGASLLGVPSTRAQSPASYVHLARWGDGGERGEVEAPRWGDAGSKGTVEAPRGGDDRGTFAGDVQAPRSERSEPAGQA